MKELTVGELRKALEGVPDSTPVRLSSDTGVDQGYGEITVENAYYSKLYGCFDIYANDHDTADDEECESCETDQEYRDRLARAMSFVNAINAKLG